MKFDTEGTYTLTYTATDSCGNSTSENRTVVVASPRTVLYTDGTLIINEQPEDRASNEALHGAATNTYIPFDPNGSTNTKKYIFAGDTDRPWNTQRESIKSIEFGSAISPTSTAYWFRRCNNCTSINLSNLDTSNVTDMKFMFSSSGFVSLDLSNLNTSNVTDMNSMFYYCQELKTLDLSGFDTSKVANMGAMFRYDIALETIYASNAFTVIETIESTNMFGNMSTNLVGGAGTTWSASNTNNKTYAHIDGGTSNPGYFTAKE